MFHKTSEEDEGGKQLEDVVDYSGSEAAEDWEDGTTLFSGFMDTDSLSVIRVEPRQVCSSTRRVGLTQIR
jgi:hypothetical protein